MARVGAEPVADRRRRPSPQRQRVARSRVARGVEVLEQVGVVPHERGAGGQVRQVVEGVLGSRSPARERDDTPRRSVAQVGGGAPRVDGVVKLGVRRERRHQQGGVA